MEIDLLELEILLATQFLSSQACGASIIEQLHKNERRIRWPARVYAALDRLEREGLIRKTPGRQTVPGRHDRRRSVITLTAPGRQMLRQSLQIIDLLRQDGESAKPDRVTR
jgi:DNA-binding PadR family transcriptional regulator